MSSVEELLESFRANPKAARFLDVKRVCEHYFGKPRVHGSHYVFRTPWRGDPRVNIQNKSGYVAPYQVKQVLSAIERMEAQRD